MSESIDKMLICPNISYMYTNIGVCDKILITLKENVYLSRKKLVNINKMLASISKSKLRKNVGVGDKVFTC
jgi:hypothetical protein